MNSENLNEALIHAIKSKIPGEQIASKIADIICLGKEAVYRRLRGDVQFSFDEVALIAQKLKISLDEIIGYADDEYTIFHFRPIRFTDLKEKDFRMHNSVVDLLRNIDHFTSPEVGYAINRIPSFLINRYENLTKLYALKWSYHFDNTNRMKPFHEIRDEQRLIDLNKEYARLSERIPITYCIIDRAVFYFVKNDLNTFKELNYIKDEDVQRVKDELFLLIDDMEEIAERGGFSNGNKLDFYVSDTNFDAMYGYIESDQFKEAFVGAFSRNCLIARSEEMYEVIKNSVHTLKHVSTNISGTGGRQRVKYFQEQRQVVANIL